MTQPALPHQGSYVSNSHSFTPLQNQATQTSQSQNLLSYQTGATPTATNSQFANVSNSKLINGNIVNPIASNGAAIPTKIARPSTTGNTTTTSTHNDSTIVGLHFKIGKKIGEGSFGVLFEGVNTLTDAPVAIKFEPRRTEAPQLKDEYRAYKILTGTPGIPRAYYFGQEALHNILVIDLLGPSLEDLFEWCGRRFSVKTVVQVAVQMITLIEDLHAHDLIYRDIKPDNFLVGRHGEPDENQIHLIDFGMAKQYRDPKTKQHIPYREKKSLSGTARYMSINTHLGREQSRRDDMEALGHVFFYFLRGQLPWQGLKAPNNKLKYEKIGEKKRSTSVYDLAQGLPIQFGRYLEVVRNLGFEETPDYEGYRQLLLSILDDLNLSADGEYDWMKLNGGRGWDLSINKKPNLHGYGHPNPPGERQRRHEAANGPHNNHAAAAGGKDMLYNAGNNPNAPDNINGNVAQLDPTSFEAFQQQAQQKYALQQQRQQQQHMLHQQQRHRQMLQQQQQQQQQQQYRAQMVMGGVGHGPNMLSSPGTTATAGAAATPTGVYSPNNGVPYNFQSAQQPVRDTYASRQSAPQQPVQQLPQSPAQVHVQPPPSIPAPASSIKHQTASNSSESNEGFFAKFACC